MESDAVFDGLPTETQAVIRSYVKDTSGIFGPLLDGMILYGSAVRGEFFARPVQSQCAAAAHVP